MRGPETDKLVLQERDRIVAYLNEGKVAALAWAIDHGRHLPRMPLEPADDEGAVYIERSQATTYLRSFRKDELASEIEAGKHVPDGE